MEKVIYKIVRFSQEFSANCCHEMASRGGSFISDLFGWNHVVEESTFDTLEDAEKAFESMKYADHCFNQHSDLARLVVYASELSEWHIELDEDGDEVAREYWDTVDASELGKIKYVENGERDEDGEKRYTMTIFCADGSEEIGETI